MRGNPARARKRSCVDWRPAVGGETSRLADPRLSFRKRRQGHADSSEHIAGRCAMKLRDTLSEAVRAASKGGEPALVAFLTAGFPSKERFREHLQAVAAGADVVEIGVPFTDPMADGVTIQRSSQAALAQGVSLRWIFSELEAIPRLKTPLLLMSYLNPLLAFGLQPLAEAAARAGVSGFIVPDLPLDESQELRAALDARQIALVQMVTPVTKPDRMKQLCDGSQGFVYAV